MSWFLPSIEGNHELIKLLCIIVILSGFIWVYDEIQVSDRIKNQVPCEIIKHVIEQGKDTYCLSQGSMYLLRSIYYVKHVQPEFCLATYMMFHVLIVRLEDQLYYLASAAGQNNLFQGSSYSYESNTQAVCYPSQDRKEVRFLPRSNSFQTTVIQKDFQFEWIQGEEYKRV